MSDISSVNQQDLKFKDIKKGNPTRLHFIYRYKVKNYFSTLRKKFFVPNRNTGLILTDEKVIVGITDNINDSQVSIGISSNQNPGASKLENKRNVVFISSDLQDIDYGSSFYIYSLSPIKQNGIDHETNIYFGNLTTSHIPENQKQIFGNKEDNNSENKVTTFLSLNDIRISNHAKNSKIFVIYEKGLDSVDATKEIELKTLGLISEFEASSVDKFGNMKQTEYKLDQSKNHYAFLQTLPIKIHPNLTLASDTFDNYKNLRFDIAKKFIGGGKLIELFEGNARPPSGNYPTDKKAIDLYHAFSSILYLSKLSKTGYKEIRINDKSNINFGKIDTPKNMFGADLINIDSDGIRETSALLLKIWEEKYPEYIKDKGFVDTYHNLKVALAYLGHIVPTEYSYGMNDRINNIAFNFNFELSKEISSFDDKDIKLELKSVKYEIDQASKTISKLSKNMEQMSNNKVFDIGRITSLPQPPEQFTESVKNTQPGTTDIKNITSILGYHFYFELTGKTSYDRLFGYEANKNASIVNFSKNITVTQKFASLNSVNDKVTDDSEVEKYIEKNLIRDGFDLQNGFSAKLMRIIPEKHWTTQTKTWISCSSPLASGAHCMGSLTSGPSGYYMFNTINHKKPQQFIIEFKFVANPIQGSIIRKIDNPYMINLATWNDFKNDLGTEQSTFVLKPVKTFGINNAVKGLTDISFKSTMSPTATILLSFKYDDGTVKEKSITWELGFVDDQTIVQEGIRF